MSIRTLFLLFFAFCPFTQALAQSLEWEENFGGSDEDFANAIVPTEDSGYVIAGYSGFTGRDIRVIKIDSSGSTIWNKTHATSFDARAFDMVRTYDGGFAIAGERHSVIDSNADDFYILKLDSSGNFKWDAKYGGDETDRAFSVVQTRDSGYVMTGWTMSSGEDVSGNYGPPGTTDIWVVKIDKNGNIQWEDHLGGTGSEAAYSMVNTPDKGVVLAGYSNSSDHDVGSNYGQEDLWIVKLDSTGSIQWKKLLGGSGSEVAYDLVRTENGHYLIAADSDSADGDVGQEFGEEDLWLVKLYNNLNVAWEKNYGGSSRDEPRSIIEMENGNFLIGGYTESSDGDISDPHGWHDQWLVKVDPMGTLLWSENYGGSEADRSYSVVEAHDEGYLSAGYSQSSDGDVGGNYGDEDFWVFKTAPQGTYLSERKSRDLFKIHPNPTSGQLRLDLGRKSQEARITIRDLTGRTVKSQRVGNARTFRTTIESEPGIYFVEVRTEDGRREVRKVVKE